MRPKEILVARNIAAPSSNPNSEPNPMPTAILAIDPGAHGGYAVYDHNAVYAEKIPETEGDILDAFQNLAFQWQAEGIDPVAVIEDQVGCVGPQIRVSAASMFKFGRGFGFLLGVLQTLKFRIELVRPMTWQKSLSLGTKSDLSKTEWKNKLKAKAQQLYPQVEVTLATADALLILEYARLKNGNGH